MGDNVFADLENLFYLLVDLLIKVEIEIEMEEQLQREKYASAVTIQSYLRSTMERKAYLQRLAETKSAVGVVWTSYRNHLDRKALDAWFAYRRYLRRKEEERKRRAEELKVR